MYYTHTRTHMHNAHSRNDISMEKLTSETGMDTQIPEFFLLSLDL